MYCLRVYLCSEGVLSQTNFCKIIQNHLYKIIGKAEQIYNLHNSQNKIIVELILRKEIIFAWRNKVFAENLTAMGGH